MSGWDAFLSIFSYSSIYFNKKSQFTTPLGML
jgi:hypothetical protein